MRSTYRSDFHRFHFHGAKESVGRPEQLAVPITDPCPFDLHSNSMYSSRDIADIAYAVDKVSDVLRIDPVTVSVTGVYADEVRIQLHAGKKVLGLQVFQGVLHHSDQALAVLGLFQELVQAITHFRIQRHRGQVELFRAIYTASDQSLPASRGPCEAIAAMHAHVHSCMNANILNTCCSSSPCKLQFASLHLPRRNSFK